MASVFGQAHREVQELTATERKRFLEKSQTPESTFSELYSDESEKNRLAKKEKLQVLREQNTIMKRKTDHEIDSGERRLFFEELKLVNEYEMQLRRQFSETFARDKSLSPAQVIEAVDQALVNPLRRMREQLASSGRRREEIRAWDRSRGSSRVRDSSPSVNDRVRELSISRTVYEEDFSMV